MSITKKICIAGMSALLLFGASLCFVLPHVYGEEIYSKADIFSAGENVTSIAENCTVSGIGTGVLVETAGESATVLINQELNAECFVKEMPVLSLMAVSGAEYSYIREIEFRLTDPEDEGNYIGLRYVPTSENSITDCSYVTTNYRGVYRGLSNENGSLYTDEYGTVSWGGNFAPDVYYPSTLEFRMDYANKTTYLKNGSNYDVVLDLTNPLHVGYENEWAGFTDNRAIMSLHVKFNYTGKKGAFLLTNFLGHSLSGKFSNADQVSPTVVLRAEESFLAEMPVSAVGVEYTLPSAYAYDWYCGNADVVISVEKENVDVTAAVLDGTTFCPLEAGEYFVRYSAQNIFGENSRTIRVETQEKLPQYHIYLREKANTPVLYDYFKIPAVGVEGGTGELTVTETLKYNGKEMELDASRLIYIDKEGILSFNVTVQGYSGEAYTRRFIYEVRQGQGLTVMAHGVPYAARSGVAVELPEAEVIDGTAETGEVTTYILADGNRLEGNVWKPSAAGTASITYVAEKGTYRDTCVFTVQVYAAETFADYPQTETGGVQYSMGTDGVLCTASQDSSFYWPNPLPLNSLSLIFSITKGDFAWLDIVFTDYYYPSQQRFVRITPKDSKSSLLQINGEGEKYAIQGSFDGSSRFSLIFDGLHSQIRTASGEAVADFSMVPSDVAKVSFVFGGIRNDAEISLRQVANQVLGGLNAKPLVLTDTEMSESVIVDIGRMIYVPAAKAYDVLDGEVAVTMRITAPDDSVLYAGECSAQSFSATQWGNYKISYLVQHNGKEEDQTYVVRVADRVAPVIAVDGSIPEKVQAGKSVVIPSMTVTDNVEGTITAYVLVLQTGNFSREAVESGTKYTFAEKGVYKILFCAMDKTGNTTTVTYTVTVTD